MNTFLAEIRETIAPSPRNPGHTISGDDPRLQSRVFSGLVADDRLDFGPRSVVRSGTDSLV